MRSGEEEAEGGEGRRGVEEVDGGEGGRTKFDTESSQPWRMKPGPVTRGNGQCLLSR